METETTQVCAKPLTWKTLPGGSRVPDEQCERPEHDGPCSGDGLLKGYSGISVQEFGMLCERVERLQSVDAFDLDTEGHVAERLLSGAYQLRDFLDSSRTQHDTAAGLVMAWLERSES